MKKAGFETLVKNMHVIDRCLCVSPHAAPLTLFTADEILFCPGVILCESNKFGIVICFLFY